MLTKKPKLHKKDPTEYNFATGYPKDITEIVRPAHTSRKGVQYPEITRNYTLLSWEGSATRNQRRTDFKARLKNLKLYKRYNRDGYLPTVKKPN